RRELRLATPCACPGEAARRSCVAAKAKFIARDAQTDVPSLSWRVAEFAAVGSCRLSHFCELEVSTSNGSRRTESNRPALGLHQQPRARSTFRLYPLEHGP